MSVYPQMGLKYGVPDKVLVWGILLDIGLIRIVLKILHMFFVVKLHAIGHCEYILCAENRFFLWMCFVIP
jgi:hypothetical protein